MRPDWPAVASFPVGAKLRRAHGAYGHAVGLLLMVIGLSFATLPLEAQERRVALVIGNSNYQHVVSLDNPQSDARAISAALRGLGFEVYQYIDLNRRDAEQAIREFGRNLRYADVALLFYAGHAIQYAGVNYLAPTDAELEDEGDIDFELIDVDLIVKQMQSRPGISLIFFDACRNNPFQKMKRAARGIQSAGLAAISTLSGTYIAYATSPDQVAFDGEGDHSPFTSALLKHIDSKGLEIRTMMTRVRQDVYEATGHKQLPWDNSSLLTEFYFRPPTGPVADATVEPLQELNLAFALTDPEQQRQSLTRFLSEHPDSRYSEIARLKLRELTAPPPTSDNRQPMLAFIPPLVVEGGAVKAPLSIPQPRDPDSGDRLRARVVDLPNMGTIRGRGLQLKRGDELSIEQLTDLEYFLPLDFVGDAGQFAFQVYDSRGGSALGAVPIRILPPNQAPRLAVPPTVTATVGAGSVPLHLEPPVDPDVEDRVMVRVDRLPDEGALTLDGIELFAGAVVTGEELQRIVYAPPAEFSTPQGGTIQFVAEDGRGGKAVAEMAVVLLPANQPPQWGEDLSLRVASDAGQAEIELARPIDPDGDKLTISVVRLPIAGTVRAGGRPVEAGAALAQQNLAALTYEPSPGFIGAAGLLTLKADDGRGGAVTQSVTIVVEPRNRPPIVDPDRELVAVAGEVTPLGITRPFDPDGDDMAVRLMAVPSNGEVLIGDRSAGSGMALTVDELSQLRFRAAPDAVGTSSTLVYAVADDHGGIARSKVEISLKAPNRPPTAAAPRTVTTSAGKEPVRLVIEAPSDPDGDRLEAQIESLPIGGEVRVAGRTLGLRDRLTPDQLLSATYRATGDIIGPAGSFRYVVTDGQGGSASSETRVIVEEPNRPPMMTPGTFVEIPAQVGPVALNLPRPEDPDGDALSVTLSQVPATTTLRVGDRKLAAGDRLTVDELLNLTAETDVGAVGARESASFEVADTHGASVRGVVVIQVVPPPNRVPLVAAQSEITAEAAGDLVALAIGAPSDPDGDPLEITVTVLPRSGEVRLAERVIGVGDLLGPDELTRLVYQPPRIAGAMGSFVYEVQDGRGGRASGSVTLTVNRPPIAFPEPPVEVIAGTPATPLTMRAPVDPDGDPVVAQVTELPQAGSVWSGDRPLALGDQIPPGEFGRLTYRAEDAKPGAKGRFAYVARDNHGGEATGSVELRVARANRPPEAPGDSTVTVRADEESILVLRELPSDPDADPLTVTVLLAPYSGTLESGARQLRPRDVVSVDELAFLRYRRAAGFQGQAGVFRYRADDGRGGAAVSSVTIVVERPNQSPVGAGMRVVQVLAGRGPTSLGLEPPIDPDGDPMTAKVVAVPRSGILRHGERQLDAGATLQMDELAQLMFEAAPGVEGPLGDLRIEVDDDRGGSVVIGATMKAALPPNRRPLVLSRGGIEAILGAEPAPLGLFEPVDPDGDPLTVTVVERPQQGSLRLGGRELDVGANLAPGDVPQIAFDTTGANPGPAGAFQIEVADSRGAVVHARVPIDILLPPNQPPIAVAHQVVSAVVGVGTVPLPIEAPSDPDQDPIIIRLTAVPDNGVLVFGNRTAELGMQLTPEEFAQAKFTPNREKVLSRGDLAATSSSLNYEVDDGRGGVVAGEIVVRAEIHECDLLASSSDNIESVAPGVALTELDGGRAVAACSKAVSQFEPITRFRFELARAEQVSGRFQEAVENYRIAARMGDWAAQHNLAILLLDPPAGGAVRPDVDEAIRWLKAASEAGSTSAQKSLAAVLWRGEGAKADRSEAVRWLLEATKQNDPEAVTYLAMAYATGQGVDRDVDEAIRLLERAAAQGYAPAQTNLGSLYASGDAGRIDFGQARKWFAAAAEQHDPRGLINLATLYLLGNGVERDPVRAMKLYAGAARRAGDDAKKILAESLHVLPSDVTTEVAQTLLTQRGYSPGPIDGQFGERTRTALMQFEKDIGADATGEPSAEILLQLARP